MNLISSCSRLCPIHWSRVLSREWRYSWSSADRRCSNYIWMINNLISNSGAAYIRDLTVLWIGPVGTNFSEIWIEIQFSFKKMDLKMSRALSAALDNLSGLAHSRRQNKMATILQMDILKCTFVDKNFVFWLKFSLSFLLINHWFR